MKCIKSGFHKHGIYRGLLQTKFEDPAHQVEMQTPCPQLRLNFFRNSVNEREHHNEELNDLYSSPNIVRVIKSGRMRWAGHVARMGERSGV